MTIKIKVDPAKLYSYKETVRELRAAGLSVKEFTASYGDRSGYTGKDLAEFMGE